MAASFAALGAGSLQHPIGEPKDSEARVATCTEIGPNGLQAIVDKDSTPPSGGGFYFDCAKWSLARIPLTEVTVKYYYTLGTATSGARGWSAQAFQRCALPAKLFCFQQ